MSWDVSPFRITRDSIDIQDLYRLAYQFHSIENFILDPWRKCLLPDVSLWHSHHDHRRRNAWLVQSYAWPKRLRIACGRSNVQCWRCCWGLCINLEEWPDFCKLINAWSEFIRHRFHLCALQRLKCCLPVFLFFTLSSQWGSIPSQSVISSVASHVSLLLADTPLRKLDEEISSCLAI